MTYCTVEQAQAAGAAGDEATVLAAIAEAAQRVDAFTGDHFLPAEQTVSLRVKGQYAPSRQRVQAVESITRQAAGDTLLLPPATYDVQPHGIRFRGHGYDVLVAGAEPWSGGWANLTGPLDGAYVSVTGTFGWEAVPSSVAHATALLAADLAPQRWTPQANAEGDPTGVPPAEDVQYRDPAPERVMPAGRLERTTGNAEADRLLAGYQSAPYRFG